MEVQGGKFLTFSLENEEYGIPIQKIKEIIGIMEVTKIPKTPEYIKGVINLRGKIIPIMDLRLKFGLQAVDYNQRTCIIVVEINSIEAKRLMGIAVDTVSEVVAIEKSEIELSPTDHSQVADSFLIGIGKVKDRITLLLDIEQVLNNEEITLLKEMK